jgi:hypothetical protein
MRVSRRAEFEMGRPIEEVFDFATACDGFPLFLFPPLTTSLPLAQPSATPVLVVGERR